LHNQLGYQQQLSEAIAIVYSPIKRDRFKALRCKDSQISSILNCQAKGFHEHRDQRGKMAFEQCAHVVYVDG
jgi:hypothetical protein